MKLQLTILIIATTLHFTTPQIPTTSPLKFPIFNHMTSKFANIQTPSDYKVSPHITENWIQQRIDQFNPQDQRTFSQYYSMNDEFFTPGGPIFIFMYMAPFFSYLGEMYLSYGPVYSLAEDFNGTIVFPHHRYFDRSLVFEETTVENLRFLSINQAIEDLAHLIVDLKSHESRRDSDVILIGWDYGASMATWFAQKYPHLVTGIWASNGKFSPSFEQPEVVQIVEQQLRDFGSPGCADRIENAFNQIEDMIANNQSNIIRRRFNFCFPIPYQNGDLDVMYLYELLTTHFYAYSLVFEKSYIADYSCGRFMNAQVEHDWEALGAVIGLLNLPFPICYPNSFSYQLELIKENIHADWEMAHGRTYLYLECVEYGFFYNSGDGTSIFGSKFPSEFYKHVCEDVFGITGEQMELNYQRFTTSHGGRQPVVRNAYFTYGAVNPWIHEGIDKASIVNSSYYESIPYRSVHAELSLDIQDPHFAEVRRRVFSAIRRWLR
ncbi:dipeptidyl peptidase 2-like [Chironomus tepperi]|uniref:dipeptidyl peptidase 2-like n=1 Tax=Chironomus tepperi TaxID=113505 RepID=UPI00391F11A3